MSTQFESLYTESQVNRWGLLASSSLDNQGLARGLVLRWSKLQAGFQKLHPKPTIKICYVVCDVLILDDNPTVEDTLWIFARRIELEGEHTLTIEGASATVTIVAQEIVGSGAVTGLPLMFVVGDADPILKNLPPLPESSPATIFSLSARSKVTVELWNAQSVIAQKFSDFLNDGELLRLGTVTIFQVASLLESSNPALVISQLRWLAAIADLNPATRVMAGQARTALGWLVKESQGLVTVPPFDFTVYSTAATGLTDVLKARSSAFDTWVNMKSTNENWLKQATLTVSLQQNEAQLTRALEIRAQDALDVANNAVAGATAQLNVLIAALAKAKSEFDAGVEIWERGKTAEATIDLVKNIVNLGVAVGKLVAMVAAPGAGAASEVGGGGGAATTTTTTTNTAGFIATSLPFDSGMIGNVKRMAGPDGDGGGGGGFYAKGFKTSTTTTTKTTPAETPKAVASSVDQVKKLAETVGGGVDVMGAGTAVVNSVETIIEIGKTADKMHDLAADTLTTVTNDLEATYTVSALGGLDAVTGGSQVWQMLETQMDAIFEGQKEVFEQIGGGQGFRVTFRQLVIGAEAYCSTRLAVAEAANGLAEAKLRSKASVQAVDLTKKYAQEMAKNDALYLQLQQEAFGRLLDAKRAVYIELEKYRRAIRYFTLTADAHIPKMPDITAPVVDFIAASADISGYNLALENLRPIPQQMKDLSIHFTITDQHRTDGGAIVVQIDLSNSALDGKNRIRIDSMNVSFFGDDGQKIPVHELHVGSGGTYRDRTPNGESKTFTGNPWIKLINYDSNGKAIVEAGTYTRYSDLIFKPTPFTTWMILPKDSTIAARVKTMTLTIAGEVSDDV